MANKVTFSLEAAQASAQKMADMTGNSVLVYRSLVSDVIGNPVYGVAYTLPIYGERVGERIYPTDSVTSFTTGRRPGE